MIIQPIWQSLLSDSQRRALSPGVPVPLPERPDVLIVGGGGVGLCIAYFLAKASVGEVLVVEQGDLASGASGANGGGIFAGQQRANFPAEYRELGLASRELYAQWAEEGWAELQWRRSGSLAIQASDFSGSMAEYVRRERDIGRAAEHVTGGRLRELESVLAPDVTEGVYYPDDGRLNPLGTAISLAAEIQKLGVTIATGVRVDDIKSNGGRVVQVLTTAGEVQPGTLVITTGSAAGKLGRQLGATIPMQPAKGQLLATEPLPWRMNTNVVGEYLLSQLPGGELISGGNIELGSESTEPSDEIAAQITTAARRTIPALKDEPFVRTWTGLRPHTPDEMPIIDRLPHLGNAFVAAGHFTKGVLMAPITGRLLAEWITTGRPSIDLDFLRLDRFDAGDASR